MRIRRGALGRGALLLLAAAILLVVSSVSSELAARRVGNPPTTLVHSGTYKHAVGFGVPGENHCCEDDRDLELQDPPLWGDDVRDLQERLAALGFYRGKLHATFDRAVADALRAFQSSRGLSATGVVTNDMWSVLAPTPNPPPETTPAKPEGTVSIVIDKSKLTLTIMVDDKPFKKYPCAIGKPSTPSPVGEFMIVNKGWEPGGPFGARWLGLNIPYGTYGIHGTNRPHSIGTMASGGCIRMFNHHVIEIFPWVPVGTKVLILGPQPTAYMGRTLKRGQIGTDVQYLQYRVRQAGFKSGSIDGRFGEDLEEAIKQIQRFYGLPVTGVAGPNEFHVLGMK